MFSFKLFISILFIVCITMSIMFYFMKSMVNLMPWKSKLNLKMILFPNETIFSSFFINGFLLFSFLNLISLVCFSFPITTTLSFNLSFAFILWMVSFAFLMNKKNSMGSLLPLNSPWYLISFLSIVEMISISVRPITLCFRLLANMSAGHILLSLICKLPYFTWMLGSLFGLLELLVALVQSFVFFMLVSVYLEEGVSH